jgi:hypothetical protein
MTFAGDECDIDAEKVLQLCGIDAEKVLQLCGCKRARTPG